MLIILGLDNPYDSDPLDPAVPNSAGERLWKMAAGSGVSRGQYARVRRQNLYGYADGNAFTRTLLDGDVILALGDEVRRALGLPRVLMHPVRLPLGGGRRWATFRSIPHPSGRCLFYNDPFCRTLIGDLIRCLTAGAHTETSPTGRPSPSQ